MIKRNCKTCGRIFLAEDRPAFKCRECRRSSQRRYENLEELRWLMAHNCNLSDCFPEEEEY